MNPKIVVCAAAALVASAGVALAMPNTTQMSCAQAAGLVKQKGAVVLATSPTLYDRYVLDLGYCVYDQQLKPEWVPTRDNPQCFIGYTCYDPSRGGGRGGS